MWFVHANLLIERLTSVRTVDPHWGEWLNSSADFNRNHNHINAAPKQASLRTTLRPPPCNPQDLSFHIQLLCSSYLVSYNPSNTSKLQDSIHHVGIPQAILRSESIDWFIGTRFSCGHVIRLLAHPFLPLPPVTCLSFWVFLCVGGRAYWRERGRGRRYASSYRAKWYDCEKTWPSINQAILSGSNYSSTTHIPPGLVHILFWDNNKNF